MIQAKELLHFRGPIADIVDTDGNVVPVDRREEVVWPGKESDGDNESGNFPDRNKLLVEMGNRAGKLGRISGMMAKAEGSHAPSGEIQRLADSRKRVADQLSKTAEDACQACPLSQECSVSGRLGSAVLTGEIDYKKLRTAVSLTPAGKKRAGWDGYCSENGAKRK